MKIELANHSYYPKIGEKDSQHKLRKIYHAFDQKKATLEDVLTVQRETVQESIQEQEKSGLDIVTDGLIRWNDPISHIMKGLNGVEIGGLLRWFDTNCYFRQPTITGPLSRKGSLLKDEVSQASLRAKKKLKVVLTGPYTLAYFSKINTSVYQNTLEVADALTDLLAEEIKELSRYGIEHIQIDEPAYLLGPLNWKWAKKSIQKLADNKGKAKLWLVTYFGDAASIYSKLQELPVDVLGFDTTYSPSLIGQIQKLSSQKTLALGLLDGRNTKLENSKEVVKILNSLSKTFKNESLYIMPSCGLEYLPRDKALKKLKLLKEVKKGVKV